MRHAVVPNIAEGRDDSDLSYRTNIKRWYPKLALEKLFIVTSRKGDIETIFVY
jgi:hypothetical protein